MRHITLNCPVCGADERAVGDPEANKWHCFACGASGSMQITMTQVVPSREGPTEEERATSYAFSSRSSSGLQKIFFACWQRRRLPLKRPLTHSHRGGWP